MTTSVANDRNMSDNSRPLNVTFSGLESAADRKSNTFVRSSLMGKNIRGSGARGRFSSWSDGRYENELGLGADDLLPVSDIDSNVTSATSRYVSDRRQSKN